MDEDVKSVKVNCSFCGADMECPENMLQESEKHMCFECFQNTDEKNIPDDISKVHIDIPKEKLLDTMPDAMTSSMVEEMFPDIWKERKEELKEMSKKELAEEMFGAGIYVAINNFLKAMSEGANKESNKIIDSLK